MAVMRRNGGWAFAAWVGDPDRGRRQVWRGGFRTKAEAAAEERRFLVAAEQPPRPDRPTVTVEGFLADWLVQSAPTRRPTTSRSYEQVVEWFLVSHLGGLELCGLAPVHIRGMAHRTARDEAAARQRAALADHGPHGAPRAPPCAAGRVALGAHRPQPVRTSTRTTPCERGDAFVHPKIVSERLGHASIAITLDTYSHVLPSMQEDAAARVGALLDG